MGRKIPGKKHRTVVDPEKQRLKRLEKIKNRVDNPPLKPDEQEIPKGVLKIMELKKEAKQKVKKKGKKKMWKRDAPLCLEKFLYDREDIEQDIGKPEKYIPNLVQKPNETPEHFLLRVGSMAQNLIKETKFEQKFGVSIEKDKKTGATIQIVKDKDGLLEKSRRKKSQKKTLTEKRKEKKIKKITEDSAKDFSHLKDTVKFGEVVHSPPVNLPSLKLKGNDYQSRQKEKFKDLLLRDIMKQKKENNSNEYRFQLEKQERERKFIVNAYRERKKLMNKS